MYHSKTIVAAIFHNITHTRFNVLQLLIMIAGSSLVTTKIIITPFSILTSRLLYACVNFLFGFIYIYSYIHITKALMVYILYQYMYRINSKL